MSNDRRRWTKYDLACTSLVALPLLVLILLFVISAFSWRSNALAAQRSLSEATDGVDDVAEWYDGLTSTQRSVEFKAILSANYGLFARTRSPWSRLRDDPKDFLVPPGQEWDEAEYLDRITSEAEPIIQRLKELSQSSEAIWLPLIFEGYATTLPESQSAIGLSSTIQYEFADAFYKGDTRRAIAALKLLDRLFGPTQQPTSLGEEWGRASAYADAQNLVRQSLRFDVWSDEELKALQKLMSVDFSWPERWRFVTKAELVLTMHGLKTRDFAIDMERNERRLLNFVHIAPSVIVNLINQRTSVAAMSDVLDPSHRAKLQELQEARTGWSPDQWMQTPVIRGDWLAAEYQPSFTALSDHFAKSALQQRWTRCAIAIKQFLRLKDGFPESLNELTQVGLPIDQTLDYRKRPFRYRVAEDGKSCQLWTHAGDPPEDPQEIVDVMVSQSIEIR